MPKIRINLLGYNHRQIIGKAISSVLEQSYRDFEFFYMDNASSDGSLKYVKANFPDVKIIANEKNLGYAGGHNLFFLQSKSELVMVLNPDVILDKNFLENALKGFDDPQVAAVTGKMLQPGLNILDGTGIEVSRSRRAKERGQNEEDKGQYDDKPDVFGVSGTAAIYRREALEKVRMPRPVATKGSFEYFDEDFFAYFEDFDLSWRLRHAGYKCWYVPSAILYHSRAAGSSQGGYKKILSFISHHKKLPLKVKRWNWKNHLFCIVKNDFGLEFWKDLPFIFVREAAMFIFILIFETRTLGVLPEFFKDFFKMIRKRQYIKSKLSTQHFLITHY